MPGTRDSLFREQLSLGALVMQICEGWEKPLVDRFPHVDRIYVALEILTDWLIGSTPWRNFPDGSNTQPANLAVAQRPREAVFESYKFNNLLLNLSNMNFSSLLHVKQFS